jgi:hypothetical protein
VLTVHDGQVVRYADETFGLPLETAMEVGRPWEQIETWPPPSPRPRPGRPRRRGIRPADRGHVASQHHRRHHRAAVPAAAYPGAVLRPGSQDGSQHRQAPGYVRPQRTRVFTRKWHAGLYAATSGDGPGLIHTEEVSGRYRWSQSRHFAADRAGDVRPSDGDAAGRRPVGLRPRGARYMPDAPVSRWPCGRGRGRRRWCRRTSARWCGRWRARPCRTRRWGRASR